MDFLSVELVLGLTGLVGLAGELVFKRTGIPSVLFLMGFGILLGLMFHMAEPTAVMAFLPVSTGIPGTELFPIYALTVIVLYVSGMTSVLTLYQRWHPSNSAEPVAEPSVWLSLACR